MIRRYATSVIVLATVTNVAMTLGAQGTFGVPMNTPDFAQRTSNYESHATQHWDLSEAIGLHVRGVRPVGSDQNFELDTFVHRGAWTSGTTSGIDNLLVEQDGYIREARTTTAGGAIEGTIDTWTLFRSTPGIGPNGHVNHLRQFVADAQSGTADTRESFVDTDHRSTHTLAGTTKEIDALQFSNGWQLRTNGDSLELWDPRGIVHIFR